LEIRNRGPGTPSTATNGADQRPGPDRVKGRKVDCNVIEETVMDKLVLGWLLGVPVVTLVLLQYLI